MVFVLVAVLAAVVGVAGRHCFESTRSPSVAGDYSSQIDVGGADLVLYMTPTCGFCAQARSYLVARKIRYSERSLDDLVHARRFAALGVKGVPVLLTKDRMVLGYFPAEYESLLKPLQ